MNRRAIKILGFLALVAIALLAWGIITAPKYPVAVIQVTDAAGSPVEGATIKADGLRTKAGPYQSGHYGWFDREGFPPNKEIKTDPKGIALLPYPKYVFENIETGQISFAVSHPEFVADRPFRVVNTTPPAGAPLKEWLNYLASRFESRALVARTDPVVLQRGAVLILRGEVIPGSTLYAQISAVGSNSTNFWTRPAPDTLISRQIPQGPQHIRLVRLDASGGQAFSEVVKIDGVPEQTNELRLELRPGVRLLGRLDDSVPRPIRNGRVIAEITPEGLTRQVSPPTWHTWSEIAEDGSFEVNHTPSGLLEVSAICDGHISTNGPGLHRMKYPQKHLIGTNELAIVVGMEPTAPLEVKLLDEQGKPIPGVKVSTWPNIRYGEWSAVIFASDCYHTADLLRTGPIDWRQLAFSVFAGESDSNGLAVLPNLPDLVTEFSVDHAEFQLPVNDDGSGQKNRHASVKLIPGETNRMTIRLERRGKGMIGHY